MKRVCIIGCPGAGKSRLSRDLGQKLDLPVYHLDKLFWKPGWVEESKDVFDKKHREIIEKDFWIIDGMYRRTFQLRAESADTIVFLDYSRLRCLMQTIKRICESFGRVRVDLAEDCPEKFDVPFLIYIWRFPSDNRLQVLDTLATCEEKQNTLVFKTPNETRKWFRAIQAKHDK